MKRMKVAMYYAFVWLLVLLPAAGFSFALPQENQSDSRAARKFHEYRLKELRSHDEQMGLWTSYDEFVKEQESTRLFIIAYADLPGSARRYAARAKNYLMSAHGVDPARIRAIDGGYRAEAAVEIWFVPAGTQEPVPQPSDTFGDNTSAAWKYDEFRLAGWWLVYGKSYEGEAGRLDGFASTLHSNPQTRGYIVIYVGADDCEYCLSPGTEFKFAKEQKNYLVSKHQLAPSRISIIRGGRVSGGRLELWVIPRGASFPRARHSSRLKR